MTSDRLLSTCLPVAMACPLFEGLTPSEVSQRLSHPEALLCNVPSGQVVQARRPAGVPCLGLLCRGRIRVSKPVSGDRRILISTLEAGGLFGAASLFTPRWAMSCARLRPVRWRSSPSRCWRPGSGKISG